MGHALLWEVHKAVPEAARSPILLEEEELQVVDGVFPVDVVAETPVQAEEGTALVAEECEGLDPVQVQQLQPRHQQRHGAQEEQKMASCVGTSKKNQRGGRGEPSECKGVGTTTKGRKRRRRWAPAPGHHTFVIGELLVLVRQVAILSQQEIEHCVEADVLRKMHGRRLPDDFCPSSQRPHQLSAHTQQGEGIGDE